MQKEQFVLGQNRFSIHRHQNVFCIVCVCVGGAEAIVRLSLFHCVMRRTAKLGSAHGPQHILCLKTDAKLTSSRSLWPTLNGKTQRFVVRYWKLSLWLMHAIVYNRASSLAKLSLIVTLAGAERRGQ